jgi:hypothetical protein
MLTVLRTSSGTIRDSHINKHATSFYRTRQSAYKAHVPSISPSLLGCYRSRECCQPYIQSRWACEKAKTSSATNSKNKLFSTNSEPSSRVTFHIFTTALKMDRGSTPSPNIISAPTRGATTQNVRRTSHSQVILVVRITYAHRGRCDCIPPLLANLVQGAT